MTRTFRLPRLRHSSGGAASAREGDGTDASADRNARDLAADARPLAKVFVCYRRDDAAGHTGRLADRLCAQFGRQAVFRDLDSIAPGRDFTVAVRQAIGHCDAVIAVIGRDWLSSVGPDGQRRLEDPHDHVRVEIATALERDTRIIPVLVDRAEMPSPESLPADLEPFARRNAIEISDSRWDYDVQRLIDVLDPGSPETLTGSTPVIVPPRRTRPRWLPAALGAAVVVLGVLLLLGRGGGGERGRSIASGGPTTSTSSTVTTLAVPPDGQSSAGAPSGAGGQAAGPNQSQAVGRANPAATSPTIPPVAIAPPTPPPGVNDPPTAQANPSANADEVSGTWAGQAYDDRIGYFPMQVQVNTGCAVGAKCGTIYVAGGNCRGDLTFLNQTNNGTGNRYEFSVSDFTSDSSPNCTPGPGEYLGSYGNGTLAYWTSYGPWATLSPA